MPDITKQHRVVALAYDQLCTFEFGCAVEIFALKRPELGVDWYKFAVTAVARGPLRAMGGLTFTAPYTLNLLDDADTIVIPGWCNTDVAPPPALLKKLRAAHARGARICSICSGAFVLAAAGLLDGKPATTHWRYAQKLQARYPTIEVQPDALYVDAGTIITSAGSAAGLDMLLHLVRLDYGAKVSNIVAQRLVIAPHRQGGQAQFIPRPMPDINANSKSGSGFAALLDWLRSNLALDHSTASIAAHANVSPRTLQRQFKQSTGQSVIEWLIAERISMAKTLLEDADVSPTKIAELAGFGGEESYRRHFRHLTKTNPSAYRKQFLLKK